MIRELSRYITSDYGFPELLSPTLETSALAGRCVYVCVCVCVCDIRGFITWLLDIFLFNCYIHCLLCILLLHTWSTCNNNSSAGFLLNINYIFCIQCSSIQISSHKHHVRATRAILITILHHQIWVLILELASSSVNLSFGNCSVNVLRP